MMGALGSVLPLLLPPLLQVLAAAPRSQPPSAGAAAEARIGEWGEGGEARGWRGAGPRRPLIPRLLPESFLRGSSTGHRRPRPHGCR